MVFATLMAMSVTAAADPALPTIDDVFPPTVRITTNDWPTRIDRIAIDIQPSVSWISFDVGARRASRTTVAIDLPAGVQVVGMAVISRDVRVWGALRPRREATERVRDDDTAALLAWDGSTAGEDHVHVEVDSNARVELAVLLPPLPTLAIAPTAALIETPRGQFRNPTRRIDLDLSAQTAPPPYPHATADLALFAGTIDRNATPEIERRFSPAPSSSYGKRGIRGGFRLNIERFTHCYERAVQFGGPRIEGTVALKFMLGVDGTVKDVEAASDLPPDVVGCVEDVLAAWQFPQQDSPTEVNYPLTFKLAGE